MVAQRWTIGDIEICRIPYFDIGLPPEAISLTADAIAAVVAQSPVAAGWLDGEGQPLVGQAVWVVESAGSTIVIDPCGASDGFLRTGPAAIDHQQAAFAAFAAAGFDRATVDTVLLTHLDGIGMAAWMNDDGSWEPAFPAAKVCISAAEYELIAANPDISGAAVFAALDTLGAIETFETPKQLVDGVAIEAAAGHSDGHVVVTIESAGQHGMFLGHLAVSPIDLLTPRGASQLHMDPSIAADVLAAAIERAVVDGALVIGSLWPAPGAVRVLSTEPVVIEPAASLG